MASRELVNKVVDVGFVQCPRVQGAPALHGWGERESHAQVH